MKENTGFTLVELSIVLVILGLLVGGVLSGQSLIRASELRSITTQFNGFQTALNAYKDKYFAIPGDMTNATSFWGAAAAGAACITTVGTGTQTCNGNGDGLITDSIVGGQSSNEIFRIWQHLANAGLITGTFDGITHGSTTYSCTMANSPAGKISNTLWQTYNWGSVTNAANFFDGNYANSMYFGTVQANTGPGMVLKPEELWNIDTKMDDGKPATGKVKAIFSLISACTDTSSTSNMSASYLLNSAATACAPMFVQVY